MNLQALLIFNGKWHSYLRDFWQINESLLGLFLFWIPEVYALDQF